MERRATDAPYTLLVSFHTDSPARVTEARAQSGSALSYALSFAALSSILVHVYLWHWDEIKAGKSSAQPGFGVYRTENRSPLDTTTDGRCAQVRHHAPPPSQWSDT